MSLILVRQEYGGRERPYVMRTNTSGGGHLLHYFCTIIVLLGFSVTFAALAGMRAYLASQDTRTPLVREYNRAVDAWVKTGREAFTTRTDGFAWAVDKAPFGALARRNGTCGDGRTVPGSLAAPEPGQVALGTEDDGIDIARYELTSVLYGVKRAYIAAHDAANAPGLEQVSVEIGLERAKSNDVDSYTAFSTSFAPYECDVLSVSRAPGAAGGGDARNTRNGGTWSPGQTAGSDEVRCDECSRDDELEGALTRSNGCDARCLPGAANRDIVAARRWVRRVVLVRSQVEDGKVAGIMRKPAVGTCTLFHGSWERTTRHESVWDARLACAHDRAPPEDVDLELEVRARDDPHILAGEMTGCTFRFGPNADENATAAAFFALGAFVTLALASRLAGQWSHLQCSHDLLLSRIQLWLTLPLRLLQIHRLYHTHDWESWYWEGWFVMWKVPRAKKVQLTHRPPSVSAVAGDLAQGCPTTPHRPQQELRLSLVPLRRDGSGF